MADLSYKIVNVDESNVDVAGVFCQKSRKNEEDARANRVARI